MSSSQASTLAQALAGSPKYAPSYIDLAEAMKIGKCVPAGTKFTNYGSYLRAKKAALIGCCCANPTGCANLFRNGPC